MDIPRRTAVASLKQGRRAWFGRELHATFPRAFGYRGTYRRVPEILARLFARLVTSEIDAFRGLRRRNVARAAATRTPARPPQCRSRRAQRVRPPCEQFSDIELAGSACVEFLERSVANREPGATALRPEERGA
jgi:hypothetical protein